MTCDAMLSLYLYTLWLNCSEGSYLTSKHGDVGLGITARTGLIAVSLARSKREALTEKPTPESSTAIPYRMRLLKLPFTHRVPTGKALGVQGSGSTIGA